MASDDLDVLTVEQDVDGSAATGPGWLRVLLTLIGAGVLAAIVIVIISAVLTADQPTATYGPALDEVCGGEASCSDLSLAQVNQLVALELPEGTEIITSRYEEGAESILVEARVALPEGAANPYDGSPYFEVDESKATVVFPAGINIETYYAATGELGALNAEGILGTDGDGRSIVAVHLVRTL